MMIKGGIMTISWFSAGVSSFIATFLAKDKIDHIIYIHIEEQHEDTLRFVNDCEKILKKEIIILQSKYKSVDNVIQQFKFINSRYGAKCTEILKKRVRKEWEKNKKNLTYVWGFDCEEKNRANRLTEQNQSNEHIFPLIENKISKRDSHIMLKDLKIKRPFMYEMGYKNNNCVGCVKGGMGYWNKIRIDFPDVFKRRAKQEREINNTCLSERKDGVFKKIFLDELDPNKGRYNDELSFDCGIHCNLDLEYKEE